VDDLRIVPFDLYVVIPSRGLVGLNLHGSGNRQKHAEGQSLGGVAVRFEGPEDVR
jgi:hypothetical protein